LNRSEPNVILTAHATKVNRPEPNWTEPQTCLAGRNHAFSSLCSAFVIHSMKKSYLITYLITFQVGIHEMTIDEWYTGWPP